MKLTEAASILGVSGNVNPEIIKRAYREACAKYHPDRNPAGLEMMKAVKGKLVCVFLTYSKIHDIPEQTATRGTQDQSTNTVAPNSGAAVVQKRLESSQSDSRREQRRETAQVFDSMAEQLKQGVQIVSAPQLFPTPHDLAARMVEIADIRLGMTVLEPSAGTGHIMQAILNDECAGAVVAVEINQQLANRLKAEFPLSDIHCRDFLQYSRGNFPVDRIIMNPPFENGSDIKHIQHALTQLKPGGRLVAICANGPRQREKLLPLVDSWEDLPTGTFNQSGTGVNTAMIVIDAPLQ